MTKSKKHTPPPANEILKIVAAARKSSLSDGLGGPFGAFVFSGDGRVVGRGVNEVLGSCDPTAHAEMQAIRDACRNLKSRDLSGYSLYATGRPCPMCMSAIIWANLDMVWYSADFEDAEKLGFRDDFIYRFIRGGCSDGSVLKLERIPSEDLKRLYHEYSIKGEIY